MHNTSVKHFKKTKSRKKRTVRTLAVLFLLILITATAQSLMESRRKARVSDSVQYADGKRSAELPAAEFPAASSAKFPAVSDTGIDTDRTYSFSLSDIPEYSGSPVYILNDNQPMFTYGDLTTQSFEFYSEQDSLGRCAEAFACIGTDLFPTEPRESIYQVKPTGWTVSRYDFIDGESLFNRCHLLGFQLTGENANEKNLITGTRYLNVQGMLPYENMVHDYVEDTGNHVLYRVTPIFADDEMVARGVTMEGFSVEDEGEELCFYVYVYNVQPGVAISYTDGSNFPDDTTLQYAP